MPSSGSEPFDPVSGVQPPRSSPPSFGSDISFSMFPAPNHEQIHEPEPADVAPAVEGLDAPITPKPSNDNEPPPSAQQAPKERSESSEDKEKEEDSDEDMDPAEEIEGFNWDELHERYHDAMNRASTEEVELLNEFAQLMNYFKIWAEAGHNHESDRTYHRLRTRMTYVQNSEQKLEKTRQHYIDVVRAFESALTLLQSTGFGG